VWGGDATSSLWARGRSMVVGVNCCVIGGAIGVVVVGGSIGLVVVVSFQWGKRVVVACCPLMDETHATEPCTRRRVKRRRGNAGIQHRGVVPSHLVRRWAPSEMVQPPSSARQHRRGRPATQWRGDRGSLFAGRRHRATWRGRCHRARGAHRTPPGQSRPRGRWWAWRNGWGIGAKCRQYGIVV